MAQTIRAYALITNLEWFEIAISAARNAIPIAALPLAALPTERIQYACANR